ncbi:MAG: hypothetical protein Q9160_008671 [Pyrenula sp. 1 TL-2023]
MAKLLFLATSLVSSALAGTVIWDGRFNDLTSSSDLNNWSWSNQVGPYQYYIHGSSPITSYVNLSPSYKNPADTTSKQGVKISIDSTSYWNGQNMRRTELIPQTTAPINQGLVYYHFSMQRTGTNAPLNTLEHQVNFFESHFTEMKYGLISGASGTSDPQLRWMVNQVTYWNTQFDPNVWHNVAYGIDFTAGTVTFYHSTGSSPLVKTAGPISAATSSNGADWHLGVLRLPMSSSLTNPDNEDWYFSGVYVESGSLTTSVGSGSGSGGSAPISSTSVTSKAATPSTTLKTSVKPSTTSAAPAPTSTAGAGGSIAKYAQCGGQGWTGSGACVAGSTCTKVNDYYSQCL